MNAEQQQQYLAQLQANAQAAMGQPQQQAPGAQPQIDPALAALLGSSQPQFQQPAQPQFQQQPVQQFQQQPAQPQFQQQPVQQFQQQPAQPVQQQQQQAPQFQQFAAAPTVGGMVPGTDAPPPARRGRGKKTAEVETHAAEIGGASDDTLARATIIAACLRVGMTDPTQIKFYVGLLDA